jgi:hypothetical protein
MQDKYKCLFMTMVWLIWTGFVGWGMLIKPDLFILISFSIFVIIFTILISLTSFLFWINI